MVGELSLDEEPVVDSVADSVVADSVAEDQMPVYTAVSTSLAWIS